MTRANGRVASLDILLRALLVLALVRVLVAYNPLAPPGDDGPPGWVVPATASILVTLLWRLRDRHRRPSTEAGAAEECKR